jgi:hypothetical protein
MRAGGRWGLAVVLFLALAVWGCAAGEVTARPRQVPASRVVSTPSGPCVATVRTIEPGVVRTVYGTVEAVTPIDIDVEVAIHGNATTGRTRVFVEGGTAGCYHTTVDAAPHVDAGDRYLLFLVPPAASPAPNEPEWPKVIVAWGVDPDDTVHTIQGPMSLADVITAIRRVAPAST